MNPRDEIRELLARSAPVVQALGEADDRVTAILAGSVLEDLLRALLAANMIDEPRAVEETLGRLDFETKINLAYSFGLISKDERSDLNSIRKIRNTAAHCWDSFSVVDDDAAYDRCMGLHSANEWVSMMKVEPPGSSDFFLLVGFLCLANRLIFRHTKARQAPAAFEAPTEFAPLSFGGPMGEERWEES